MDEKEIDIPDVKFVWNESKDDRDLMYWVQWLSVLVLIGLAVYMIIHKSYCSVKIYRNCTDVFLSGRIP